MDGSVESWRTSKTVGSLLECEKDVRRRVQLASLAFVKFQVLWHSQTIRLKTKVRLCICHMESILLYDAGTWDLKHEVLESLDACQRRHPRRLCGIVFPHRIANGKLHLTCGCRPVSLKIAERRWTFFRAHSSPASRQSCTKSGGYLDRFAY